VRQEGGQNVGSVDSWQEGHEGKTRSGSSETERKEKKVRTTFQAKLFF